MRTWSSPTDSFGWQSISSLDCWGGSILGFFPNLFSSAFSCFLAAALCSAVSFFAAAF